MPNPVIENPYRKNGHYQKQDNAQGIPSDSISNLTLKEMY
jgi:hypothetical protein